MPMHFVWWCCVRELDALSRNLLCRDWQCGRFWRSHIRSLWWRWRVGRWRGFRRWWMGTWRWKGLGAGVRLGCKCENYADNTKCITYWLSFPCCRSVCFISRKWQQTVLEMQELQSVTYWQVNLQSFLTRRSLDRDIYISSKSNRMRTEWIAPYNKNVSSSMTSVQTVANDQTLPLSCNNQGSISGQGRNWE